jgi:hypothetical protein
MESIMAVRSGDGGTQPLLHLSVIHQASLLNDRAASRDHDEVGDSPNLEARGELGIGFGVDFEHECLAGHIGSGSSDFGSGSAAGPAPRRPEINQDRHGRVLDDFVKQRGIGCKGFG